MIEILRWLGILIRATVRERRDLVLENLAIRQQLAVLKRRKGVPRLIRGQLMLEVTPETAMVGDGSGKITASPN